MGLKGFNDGLRKHFKYPEKTVKLSTFRGKRIAIDFHNEMYKKLYGAQKRTIGTTDVVLCTVDRSEVLRTWLVMELNFLLDLIEAGITPVAVFDGDHPPEKKATKEKRTKEAIAKQNRIVELQADIAKYDPVSVPQDKVEELKKLYSSSVHVPYDEVEFLRNILSGIGIPVVQATGDAEQLCSMLCIDGIVEAVYSTDTDNYAHGCPTLITKIGRKIWSKELNCYDRDITVVYLADILSELKMTFDTFVDFCIMCGTDYNDNIRNCGFKRSYEHMIQYGTIEKLQSLDTSILNHVKTRSLFAIRPWKDCYVSGTFNIPDIVVDTARDRLESIGRSDVLDRLIPACKNCPVPQDRGHQLLPTRKQVKIRTPGMTKLEIRE